MPKGQKKKNYQYENAPVLDDNIEKIQYQISGKQIIELLNPSKAYKIITLFIKFE